MKLYEISSSFIQPRHSNQTSKSFLQVAQVPIASAIVTSKLILTPEGEQITEASGRDKEF